jgi:hypothetical protein
MVQTTAFTFLGCWRLIIFALVTCLRQVFITRWSPYSFRCNNTCWDWHFLILDNITRCPSYVTPSCSFLGPTFGKLNGLVLSLGISFFSRLFTQIGVCLLLIYILKNIVQPHHFYSCVGPRVSVWLLIHPTTPTFCLSSTHFFTALCTHINLPHPISCPPFAVLVWSYR